jgi:hypothetical protein
MKITSVFCLCLTGGQTPIIREKASYAENWQAAQYPLLIFLPKAVSIWWAAALP